MQTRLTDVGMIEPGEDVNLVDNCLEVALERLFADHLVSVSRKKSSCTITSSRAKSSTSSSNSRQAENCLSLTDVGMIEPGEDVNLVDNCLEVALERLFADHLDR
jgi:hypothetical protein